LWKALEAWTDYLTLMAYDHRAQVIERLGRTTMKHSTGPVELGVEFSSKAPQGESLHGQGQEDLMMLLQSLRKKLKAQPHYAGLSVHDWEALKLFEQVEAEGVQP